MKARPVYPGAMLFISRRVHKRQFLLRPSEELNQLVEYIIAVTAERHGIRLYSICVMSNHWHAMLSDPEGRIVDFERDCHSFIARAVNTLYGESESLWSSEQTSRVHCAEPHDTLGKVVYTMANPVEAGLVAHGKNWPGIRRAWPMRAKVIERPKVFFRGEDEGGGWPKQAQLSCHRPPGFETYSDEDLAALLRDAIEDRERIARDKLRKAGRSFLGRKRCRSQRRYDAPATREERSDIRPTVAAKSKWTRIERLRQNRAWLEAYEAAKERFRAGDRSARFPYGTWKLRVYYGCLVDPPPPALAFATA